MEEKRPEDNKNRDPEIASFHIQAYWFMSFSEKTSAVKI